MGIISEGLWYVLDKSAEQSLAGGARGVGLGPVPLLVGFVPPGVLGVMFGPVVNGVTLDTMLDGPTVEAGCGAAPAAPPPGEV